jgi:hypothetical protein
MLHQSEKLSSSGQDLGSRILFENRIGFSGTPSDLLPLDLGRCGYEKGSDGKMLHVLNDATVACIRHSASDWSVPALLTSVAQAKPQFHTLIDVGAIVTGLSNRAVAEFLLAHGLSWCEGVVFIDEHDEKMILVRSTMRAVVLSQCGISVNKRFAFYDQVHTTGIDIKHCLNARGAVTLGKDMVFRDLAQGAFRLRGIGEGQTIELLVIPEVRAHARRAPCRTGWLLCPHRHHS